MVFRVGQQQFAIATQFIRGTGIDDGAASGWESDDPAECLSSCDMRGLLGLRAEESTGDRPSILVQVSRDNRLRQPVYGAQQSSTCHVRLYVDEIIGPEEVVTRPLPYFLTGQRLFSGVTLAGSGTIMVLLDPNGLMETITERNETIMPETTYTDTGTVESKPRVLVVDDSFTTRRAIANILKRNGFETDLAADGKEALDRVKSEHYDMIFSDVEMPHMNGFELLRQLRLLETDSHIPVVFVTSRGDKESQRTAEVLKAEGYIVKPVREETIMTAIQAQLSVTV
ncbi:MAG: response regulator [Pirellulaceae bacterium]